VVERNAFVDGGTPLKAESTGGQLEMTSSGLALREEAHHLAQRFFGNEEAGSEFVDQLLDICTRVQGKDFLIIHNPGGWGQSQFDRCLEWEKSIVVGISTTIREMGYNSVLIQYFRTRDARWERMRDLKEQFRFFAFKSTVMAAGLEFVIRHINALRVILIGVSQGAAFSNAVMQKLGRPCQVYSVELGFPFQYRRWGRVTERTLAIDSNGVIPDALAHGSLRIGIGVLMAAPFKWAWYRLRNKPVNFAHCVSAPGHEYDWGNTDIQRRITDFLEANFAADAPNRGPGEAPA